MLLYLCPHRQHTNANTQMKVQRKHLLHKSTLTFVRGTGGEPACGGDVIIFVLREVVLDFFDQGEASGKGSRSWGGGGLGEEAAGSSQGWGGGIQWGKMKVGATQRRSRKHIILKVQGCPTCWGLCGKIKQMSNVVQQHKTATLKHRI